MWFELFHKQLNCLPWGTGNMGDMAGAAMVLWGLLGA